MWNAILDETGGPWAVSPIHGNTDPNAQYPVVIISKTTHEITYTGTYWYLTHLSKFVRPGAVRIESTASAKRVRVMTFLTPEGGYVAQLLNSRNENADVNLEVKRKSLHLSLPVRSITTANW